MRVRAAVLYRKTASIPQWRIYQAKLLLQLFDDAGESFVDDSPVGLSEFDAANAPIRIVILLRLLVMNDHSDKFAASRCIFLTASAIVNSSSAGVICARRSLRHHVFLEGSVG